MYFLYCKPRILPYFSPLPVSSFVFSYSVVQSDPFPELAPSAHGFSLSSLCSASLSESLSVSSPVSSSSAVWSAFPYVSSCKFPGIASTASTLVLPVLSPWLTVASPLSKAMSAPPNRHTPSHASSVTTSSRACS